MKSKERFIRSSFSALVIGIGILILVTVISVFLVVEVSVIVVIGLLLGLIPGIGSNVQVTVIGLMFLVTVFFGAHMVIKTTRSFEKYKQLRREALKSA